MKNHSWFCNTGIIRTCARIDVQFRHFLSTIFSKLYCFSLLFAQQILWQENVLMCRHNTSSLYDFILMVEQCIRFEISKLAIYKWKGRGCMVNAEKRTETLSNLFLTSILIVVKLESRWNPYIMESKAFSWYTTYKCSRLSTYKILLGEKNTYVPFLTAHTNRVKTNDHNLTL